MTQDTPEAVTRMVERFIIWYADHVDRTVDRALIRSRLTDEAIKLYAAGRCDGMVNEAIDCVKHCENAVRDERERIVEWAKHRPQKELAQCNIFLHDLLNHLTTNPNTTP